MKHASRLPLVRARLLLALAVAAMACIHDAPAYLLKVSAEVPHQPTYSLFVEPAAGVGPVTSLIASAHHYIRLEIYEMTDQAVFAALAHARQRGVAVRVLLERHPFGGGSYANAAFSELRAGGISVRWANPAFTYTHEKAVNVDGRIAGIFTFNLSYSGLTSNREFGVIDRNRRDVTEIGRIFNADWNRAPMRRAASSDLVISPINSRKALTYLIDHARHSLLLYEEEMDDASIESHLISAARRGVRVRLLTSSNSAGADRVRLGGVGVRILSNPFIHAKAIIADGSRLFVGSENVSATSLDRNRELGIVLTQQAALSAVSRTFRFDWKVAAGVGGKPPPVNGKLKLTLSADPAKVRRGQVLTITARTATRAMCTIKVTYPDGYVSHASALGPRTADSSGSASWSWHVGSTVNGTAHATVICWLAKKSSRKTIPFQIVAA
jgi:cardiolipin synthase